MGKPGGHSVRQRDVHSQQVASRQEGGPDLDAGSPDPGALDSGSLDLGSLNAGGLGECGAGREFSAARLRFVLDPGSGVPTYLQLVHQVEQATRLGYLTVGDKLPRVKDAVADLAINPNTVLKAYRELKHRGIAEGKPGQGTFVRGVPKVTPLRAGRAVPGASGLDRHGGGQRAGRRGDVRPVRSFAAGPPGSWRSRDRRSRARDRRGRGVGGDAIDGGALGVGAGACGSTRPHRGSGRLRGRGDRRRDHARAVGAHAGCRRVVPARRGCAGRSGRHGKLLHVGGRPLAAASASCRPPGPLSNGPGYLALGDSIAFGYQPPEVIRGTAYLDPAEFAGYPEVVADALRMHLVNAACPGRRQPA